MRTERVVNGIEARYARGQREFCLGVSDDWTAIKAALQARGWTVGVVPCGLYGIEAITISR